MYRWEIVGIASLSLLVLVLGGLPSEAQQADAEKFFHPSEVEVFSISLTFDLGTPSAEIFRRASFEFVNSAINFLPLDDGVKIDMSGVLPDELLSRLSIQRRVPTKEGRVQYQLSAYIDMRKFLLFLSSGQTSILVDIKGCVELTPFLKKALFEFSASATFTCVLKREEKKSPFYPNSEIIKVDGIVFSNQKRVPISLRKELLFFSVPPYYEFYEELRDILSKNFLPKYKKKEYVISAMKDKFISFMSSISKKAYFIAVIPEYYKRKKDFVESKIEFLYFPVVRDEAVEDLIIKEVEKIQGNIVR